MTKESTVQPLTGRTPYTHVVLDIEGTTTPITFVHDVLFPYVLEHLRTFVTSHYSEAECLSHIIELREQAKRDQEDGRDGVVLIKDASEDKAVVIDSVVKSVEWLMGADRKVGALKGLQGYMWRSAYESGEIKGEVYPDVVPAFQQWSSENIPIYIYSSGSVAAQKLLFGYSISGDLLHFFKGHFDTSIGMKVERDSYERIAKEIGESPEKILFVSDNIHEIEAALAANFQTAIASRPGNAALPSNATSTSLQIANKTGPIVHSFSEFFSRPDVFAAQKPENSAGFKLEDLIHLETMFEELGREDGLRDGSAVGLTEGKMAGTQRGLAMGKEAGFYEGVAEMYLACHKDGKLKLSERSVKALQQLQTLAHEFPLYNPSDESVSSEVADPTTALDRLRGKFKVSMSSLGDIAKGQKFREEGENVVMNF
ncbi:HAD-like domain-containing protein [Phlyctochytrium arcticum]|nr:HAD-like domain-containing protein [Phlyctochytrium arcticum]